MEALGSALVDELAFVDSVLPDSKALHDIDCPPIWPQVQKKCDIYKRTAKECNGSRENRLNTMVQKTLELQPQIDLLKVSLGNCKAKLARQEQSAPPTPSFRPRKATQTNNPNSSGLVSAEDCAMIENNLKSMIRQVPWVEGKAFQKIAITSMAYPAAGKLSPSYDKNPEKLTEAILADMKEKRDLLAGAQKQNLKFFRCLTESDANSDQCDPKELRKYVSSLPELRDFETEVYQGPQGAKLKSHFGAEACLMEKSADREKTKSGVSNGIEIVTGMAGSVTAYALLNYSARAVRSYFLARGLGAGAAATYAFTHPNDLADIGNGMWNTHEKCKEARLEVINIARSTEANQEKICSASSELLSAAIRKHSDCLTTALTSSLAALPFVPGTIVGRAAPQEISKAALSPTHQHRNTIFESRNLPDEHYASEVKRGSTDGSRRSSSEVASDSVGTGSHTQAVEQNVEVPSATGLPRLRGVFDDEPAKVLNLARIAREAVVFKVGSPEGRKFLENLKDGTYIYVMTRDGDMAFIRQELAPQAGDNKDKILGNHAALVALLKDRAKKQNRPPPEVVAAGARVIRGGAPRMHNQAGTFRGGAESLHYAEEAVVATGGPRSVETVEVSALFNQAAKPTVTPQEARIQRKLEEQKAAREGKKRAAKERKSNHTDAAIEAKLTLKYESDLGPEGINYRKSLKIMTAIQKAFPTQKQFDSAMFAKFREVFDLARNPMDQQIGPLVMTFARIWYNPREGLATNFRNFLRSPDAPIKAELQKDEHFRDKDQMKVAVEKLKKLAEAMGVDVKDLN